MPLWIHEIRRDLSYVLMDTSGSSINARKSRVFRILTATPWKAIHNTGHTYAHSHTVNTHLHTCVTHTETSYNNATQV